MAEDKPVTPEEIKALNAKAKALMEESKKLEAFYKSAKPPKRLLEGLVKAYMDAIKVSNGLTSARASCTTAVQAAEKNLTKATLAAATAALTKHAEEVKKENAAKPANKAKVDAFEAAMAKIGASLKKLA
jgi:hypothetical protein